MSDDEYSASDEEIDEVEEVLRKKLEEASQLDATLQAVPRLDYRLIPLDQAWAQLRSRSPALQRQELVNADGVDAQPFLVKDGFVVESIARKDDDRHLSSGQSEQHASTSLAYTAELHARPRRVRGGRLEDELDGRAAMPWQCACRRSRSARCCIGGCTPRGLW